MGNTVTIYAESGDKLCDLLPEDGSYRNREIKGDDEVTLTVLSAVSLHLPLGSYLLYDGIRYTLEEPPYIKKQGTRQLEYTCVFSAPVSMLKRYIFRNTVDGRLKFNLTAKPHEHLAMLVKNMNLRAGGGWTAGACVEDVEKVVTYDYTTCWDALEQIASAFGTEWEVKDREISLKKVEYFTDAPLALSYGRGNGLLPGVSRDNRDGEAGGLEIVYAIGGERNVIPSRNTGGEKRGNPLIPGIAPIVVNPDKDLASPVQAAAASTPAQVAASSPAGVSVASTDSAGVAIGNKTLILPRGQELEYGGEVYCTDAQGYYVYKKNKPFFSRKEGALDCSDIYPSRVGTISAVITVDADKHFYDFKDASIPSDLDFAACQMEGEKITVIFQDGMLAGKEFDVKAYIHAERRFELVPQEIDGVTMPDDVFKPVVGGKYAVFGISLPDAYVCDNTTKTGASWDMFRKAAAYLHEHSDYLFTFGGKLDGIWAKRNWEAIKDRIVLGGTVLFQDNQLQADGVRIRITGIRQSLNDPHSPELTLSNETIGQRLLGRIEQAESQDVLIDASASSQRQFTKRTFRDAKETMQALNDALKSFGGEFTAGISPVAVNTMQLLVGSEQCQFEFVSGDESDTVVDHNAWFDKADKKFHCAEGWVRYTSGSVMTVNPWLYAHAPEFTSGALEAGKPYYVYMRVSGKSGEFIVSDTPKDLTAGSIRYLWLGILGSEQSGNRSWCPMYGYTEIAPGRIRVNKIQSTDGKTYFDLANNEIGGRINFKDGFVSGLIGVSQDGVNINAGMNGGGGTNPVRFWAGATETNRDAAPYRVYDDGSVVMNNATIQGNSILNDVKIQGGSVLNDVIIQGNSIFTGDSVFKGIIKPVRIEISINNWMDYYKYSHSATGSDGVTTRYYTFDYTKAFGLRAEVIWRFAPESLSTGSVKYKCYYNMPAQLHTTKYGGVEPNDFLGNEVRLINLSGIDLECIGKVVVDDTSGAYGAFLDSTEIGVGKLPNNWEVYLRCAIDIYGQQKVKRIGWHSVYQNNKNTYTP